MEKDGYEKQESRDPSDSPVSGRPESRVDGGKIKVCKRPRYQEEDQP